MARPTKLNPKRQADIVSRLTAGVYFDTACVSSGITEQTGHNWMARARDSLALISEHGEDGAELSAEEVEELVPEKERPFVAFYHAVKEASADAEVGALALLRAGGQNWQAQAWFLERRFSERWRRRDHFTVSPKGEQETRETVEQIRAELADADVDALEAEIAAMLKAKGE